MKEVTIYTHDGTPLARFLVPPWQTPVEVYVWGERLFLLRADGRYTEAQGSFFLHTHTEVRLDLVGEIGKLDADHEDGA